VSGERANDREALVAKDDSNLRPARAQSYGTARCGPAYRVMWQGSVGEAP